MRHFEQNAIQYVKIRAVETKNADKARIDEMIAEASGLTIDADYMVARILNSRDVTLNFHPDRFSSNGHMIIENLISGGQYHNQFVTGTSNGGRTAYPGGDRDIWEKNMFGGAYHGEEPTYNHRPKYGALNLMNYLDGASARFGSCFFTLSN